MVRLTLKGQRNREGKPLRTDFGLGGALSPIRTTKHKTAWRILMPSEKERSLSLSSRMRVYCLLCRDGASERGNVSREVAERSLGHKVENEAKRGYLWSDLLEKRRGLMAALSWRADQGHVCGR